MGTQLRLGFNGPREYAGLKFEVTPDQHRRVVEWVLDQAPRPPSVAYCFTPTGVGVLVEAVVWSGTLREKRLNVTDYASW